ncbi:MAG: hypothetical protein QHH14_03050 [Clostridiales bacterium]|nr:hypothetical protein [Clostridiales bacterium]
MRKLRAYPILIAYFFGTVFFLHAQVEAPSKEEEHVLKTLNGFKTGIEQGNLEIGRQITTGDFYPLFKSFYESLASIYSQHKASLPMEIGHLKILKSGLAKVEVYLNPARNLFIFTLKKEEGVWKISHLEGIRFPFYSVPDLPYRNIYEIPEDQRKFMTAETELNFMTRVFFYLKEQCGEERAENFFLDGPGYKVAMEAWLPFLEGPAQFALFFVIMESNFYGSLCEVTKADDREAEVRCLKLAALEVLKRGYAIPKFSYEEFIALIKAIMKHRAEHCGLEIDMSFEDTSCLIKIKRK